MIELINKKLYLFDFGDTLFKTISFDFEKGLKALCHHSNTHESYSEIISHSKELEFLFKEKSASIFEIDIKKYLKLLFELIDTKVNLDYQELELVFWQCSCEFTLFKDVINLLDLLRLKNCKIGIISNSVFSSETLKHELKKNGLLSHFDLVISSCDYGIKKPSKFLYKIALQKLNVLEENAIFIGNKISTDINGAENAQIDSLLFDPENNNQYKHKITAYNEIIKKLQM